MIDTEGGQNESSFNRNNRLARDNQYERAHHRRVTMFLVFICVVTFYGLYRTQQYVTDVHRSADRLEKIEQQLALTCKDRAMARAVLRDYMLRDQELTDAWRARIAVEFKSIPCD